MREHVGSPAHRALGPQAGRSYLLLNSSQVGLACVVGGAAAMRPLTLCDSRLFLALHFPTGLLCSFTSSTARVTRTFNLLIPHTGAGQAGRSSRFAGLCFC